MIPDHVKRELIHMYQTRSRLMAVHLWKMYMDKERLYRMTYFNDDSITRVSMDDCRKAIEMEISWMAK